MRHPKQHATALVALIVMVATVPFTAFANDGVEMAGDILLFVTPVTAAGIAIGLRDGEGLFQFGESAALTWAVTYVIKHSSDTVRPNGGSGSFPSGHTSLSFCTAEFVRARYGWVYGLPFYGVASFVGYSRIESMNHYPRDVVAGAAIGIFIGHVFTKPYRGWAIEPHVAANVYGCRLVKCW